jgi:Cu(I)/Ag(I) efflux system membrane fusion protein
MKPLSLIGLGIALGALLMLLLDGGSAGTAGGGDASPAASGEREPLYWVAPMDASYRRDGPGKSPMGMDLVPVYADDGADEGLVSISPQIASNLGVRVAAVERMTIGDTLRSVGYVRFDEGHLVHEHPRVSGWVERLYIESEGEPVEAGEPLYTLYSPQLVSAQEELLLAVKRGVPELIAASTERLRALHIPEALIEQLRGGGKVTQTVTFRASQAGVVDKLNIREGFFVEPGTTLMSIGALDPIWVEVEVFERQAARVQPGLPVRMSLPYLPGREWQGEVDYVYPTVDPQLRTLTLRLRFDNPDRLLKPNMFAEVAIEVPPVSMLALPQEAVIRLADSTRVVREEASGAYRSVPVHLGRSIGAYREVLHGLAAGDRVVVSAQFLLDSESSRSAEFARMDPPPAGKGSRPGHQHGVNGHAAQDMPMEHGAGDAGHADHDMHAAPAQGAAEQGGHRHD